ncbi:O-antigen ligase family protein [Streptomyces sp. NPDC021354]|uniref:O-antigen ligase family protein n=1 Tax=Streptomyces sp. NPDC021354 TaxID=3154793 RepID=UPI0033F09279
MASSAARPVVRKHSSAPDIVGSAVLGCCAAWALVCAAGRTARPEGVLLAVLAVAAGYASGRIAGSLLPVASATAAALAGLGLACTVPDGAGGHDGAAHAALFTLAVGAACGAAWGARSAVLRLALRLLAVAIAATALVAGSPAGCAAGALVLLCSLAAARARRRLPGLAGLALVAAVAVGGCWAIAEDTLPDRLSAPLRDRLGEHRVRLWQDAVRIAGHGPLRGAGPDRFGELSPTVQRSVTASDDTPSSAPLQQAAGQGLPGAALLGAAFGWLLYALWRSPRRTPAVLTAAATLTALAVESVLGNALSFPEVTAGAGLIAGLATARLPDADPGPFAGVPPPLDPLPATR